MDNPTPEELLRVIQELDPVVVERAALRILNQKQAARIKELEAASAVEDMVD